MRCDEMNNSTDRALQININFFAVQQSIDHIRMSFHWSSTQCGPFVLQFFLPSTFWLKKIQKWEKRAQCINEHMCRSLRFSYAAPVSFVQNDTKKTLKILVLRSVFVFRMLQILGYQKWLPLCISDKKKWLNGAGFLWSQRYALNLFSLEFNIFNFFLTISPTSPFIWAVACHHPVATDASYLITTRNVYFGS